MKKFILILSLFTAYVCNGQVATIKLTSPKTFVVVPAISAVTDSIIINNVIDDGASLASNITFYEGGSSKKTMFLIVWDGAAYVTNRDWTKTTLKARVRSLLQAL